MLYLAKYVDETPELVKLQCMMGVDRGDCPDQKAQINDLEAKLSQLSNKTAQAEKKLTNLRAIENSIDTVTLFAKHTDPSSQLGITVGTIYKKLTEPDPEPSHFCYISLFSTDTNVLRHLTFHDTTGPVSFTPKRLAQAGLSQKTLNYARSVCKPYLIGGQ
ncbi:MAG: hypothetical protein AAGI66_06555 [Cyanobacteria bacterium P01_H01_bin.74]